MPIRGRPPSQPVCFNFTLFVSTVYGRDLVISWGSLFSETGSHSVGRGWRGIFYIAKAGFKLTVILLPHPLGARITGTSQHTSSSQSNFCITKNGILRKRSYRYLNLHDACLTTFFCLFPHKSQARADSSSTPSTRSGIASACASSGPFSHIPRLYQHPRKSFPHCQYRQPEGRS